MTYLRGIMKSWLKTNFMVAIMMTSGMTMNLPYTSSATSEFELISGLDSSFCPSGMDSSISGTSQQFDPDADLYACFGLDKQKSRYVGFDGLNTKRAYNNPWVNINPDNLAFLVPVDAQKDDLLTHPLLSNAQQHIPLAPPIYFEEIQFEVTETSLQANDDEAGNHASHTYQILHENAPRSTIPDPTLEMMKERLISPPSVSAMISHLPPTDHAQAKKPDENHGKWGFIWNTLTGCREDVSSNDTRVYAQDASWQDLQADPNNGKFNERSSFILLASNKNTAQQAVFDPTALLYDVTRHHRDDTARQVLPFDRPLADHAQEGGQPHQNLGAHSNSSSFWSQEAKAFFAQMNPNPPEKIKNTPSSPWRLFFQDFTKNGHYDDGSETVFGSLTHSRYLPSLNLKNPPDCFGMAPWFSHLISYCTYQTLRVFALYAKMQTPAFGLDQWSAYHDVAAMAKKAKTKARSLQPWVRALKSLENFTLDFHHPRQFYDIFWHHDGQEARLPDGTYGPSHTQMLIKAICQELQECTDAVLSQDHDILIRYTREDVKSITYACLNDYTEFLGKQFGMCEPTVAAQWIQNWSSEQSFINRGHTLVDQAP